MRNTKIKDVMTPHPTLISPDATLEEAAEKMQTVDCGILPVGKENKLEGIITDRDIIIRAVAEGKDPSTEIVSDYMTPKVFSCKDTDTLHDAAEQMRKHKVSRLVVKNTAGKVAGILSFGCILRKNADVDELAEVKMAS